MVRRLTLFSLVSTKIETHMVCLYSKNIVIKHSINLRGLTLKGKIAYAKRYFETQSRVNTELKINMGRFTNPSYNFLAGSKVPKSLSVRNYIIFLSPDEFKEPTAISRHKKGSPKLITRRKRMEYAMTRNLKEWGLRRVHSINSLFIEKGPSYVRLEKDVLSGTYKSNQLEILKSNVVKKQKCTNLSIIMADPNFLIAMWVRIKKSDQGNKPLVQISNTLDGISFKWFEKTATEMRNGKFKFSFSEKKNIPKSYIKKRPQIKLSRKDIIVLEAIKFLLHFIFECDFSQNSYGWVASKDGHTALSQIKSKFTEDNWYIEGNLKEQLPSFNSHILVEQLKTKINDQAFIDLVYKSLRMGYATPSKVTTPMKIKEESILLPLLAYIYLIPFDCWVEQYLIPNYIQSIRKQDNNPHFTKKIRSKPICDYSNPLALSDDNKFLLGHYLRYADNFIIGVNGSKKNCQNIALECKNFLFEKLKLTVDLEKIKITDSLSDSAFFLGYRIYRTKRSKNKISSNPQKIKARKLFYIRLDAPIDMIVKKLIDQGYADRNSGKPKTNGRFINHTLYEIIENYKTVEKRILDYYYLANNFDRVAARVHYILKYSCALTIASKLKLNTLRKVFNKYGKDLNILDSDGKIKTFYPMISYKNPKKKFFTSGLPYTNLESFISKFKS